MIYMEFYIIVAVLIAVALFVAFVFGYVGYWLLRNWFSPTHRVRARVVRRWTRELDMSMVGDTPTTLFARLGVFGRNRTAATRKAYSRLIAREPIPEVDLVWTTYVVTFLAEGKELEFQVPEETYIRCEEGTEGLLVHRGEKFKHFISRIS